MGPLVPLALAVGPTMASWGIGAAASAGAFGAGSAAYSAFALADTIGTFASASSILGSVVSGVGAITSAVGAQNAGIAANQEAELRAKQETVNAGQERASAQRQSIEEIRRLRLTQSRGQALAAASGAGALDPSVMDIMGDLETEGRYRASTALYEGEDRARNLEYSAVLDRFSGKNAKAAGKTKALSTLMSGASDMYSKYDGGSYG